MNACLAIPSPGRVSLAALMAAGLTAACGEPSKLPNVVPTTPTSELFSLAGTVTETEPTTSTRIPHAFVTLDGINEGMSTTADETGSFSFPEVKGGRFNLTASREAYETRTYFVELKRDSDYAIRLSPSLDEVIETHHGSLDGNRPPCSGAGEGCVHEYAFDVHHSGPLSLQLDWTGSADLDLWYPSDRDFEPPSTTMGTMQRSGWLEAGQRYFVTVVYLGGTGPANYTLVMRHPS